MSRITHPLEIKITESDPVLPCAPWTATREDLPGVSGVGDTEVEALNELAAALTRHATVGAHKGWPPIAPINAPVRLVIKHFGPRSHHGRGRAAIAGSVTFIRD